MPHDLEILCDTFDMWSFKFRSTITPKNFALITLCIVSLCKMTSPWGFRFFFVDINIWVLFTLRVSLLESNHSATLANSELRIWIAPSIESCWTYIVVSSAENECQDITWINNIVNVDQKPWGPQNRTLGHTYVQVYPLYFSGSLLILALVNYFCYQFNLIKRFKRPLHEQCI